jgi:hypothetical protein
MDGASGEPAENRIGSGTGEAGEWRAAGPAHGPSAAEASGARSGVTAPARSGAK